MTLTASRPAARPGTWGTHAAYWWICLSALAIAVLAVLPYLAAALDDLARDGSGIGTQVAAATADRPPAFRLAFYLHLGCGGLALLLSPLQFAGRLRARWPGLHRAVGRIAFGAIAVAGSTALVLAPVSRAGAVGTAGFGALAVLWLACAAAALRAIRRRDVAAHRRWAVRTFALTYAAVALRLWMVVLPLVQTASLGIDAAVAEDRAYLLVPFLSWVPNLLVAELYLATRHSTALERTPS
jgi:uncharacterized membrane protein